MLKRGLVWRVNSQRNGSLGHGVFYWSVGPYLPEDGETTIEGDVGTKNPKTRQPSAPNLSITGRVFLCESSWTLNRLAPNLELVA